jgi:hypothetical protein
VKPGISVPLSDSGSGVGQVVSILYVALTSHASKVIVIDEPNSFLHPAAARKLLQILNGLGHQFIITTHSSDVVRAIDPDIIHLIRRNESDSKIETLNADNIGDIRRMLDDLGVRLSDVFGSDNILWVEGPTEERCFPLLLAHAGKFPLGGTAIVSVINTGDFESPHLRAELVWQVYQRLSDGTALVPPAIAFSFDREGRTHKQIEDMERQSKGRVHFLPRRTYENYLLDADAISAVLSSSKTDSNMSPEIIGEWIKEGSGNAEYFRGTQSQTPKWQWEAAINAPALLRDLFSQLSNATVECRKTHHSVQLTRWLLANKPHHLKDLITYVVGLLSAEGPGA